MVHKKRSTHPEKSIVINEYAQNKLFYILWFVLTKGKHIKSRNVKNILQNL